MVLAWRSESVAHIHIVCPLVWLDLTSPKLTGRKAPRVGLFCHYPWLRWLSQVHSLGWRVCFPFFPCTVKVASSLYCNGQRPSTAAENLYRGLQSIDCRTDLPTAEPRMPYLHPTAYCWCSVFLFDVFWSTLIHICMPSLLDVPPKTLEQTCEYTSWTMQILLLSFNASWLAVKQFQIKGESPFFND